MKRTLSWLCGVAGGAVAMYFCDPRLGAPRRSLVRDRMVRARNDVAKFLDAAGRDLTHRWEGLAAELSGIFSAAGTTPDAVVVARVRSKLGRYVSHPRAIKVSVCAGRVILAGSVAEQEVPGLLRAVAAVRGVGDVENRLEVQCEAGQVTCSGDEAVPGEVSEWSQAHWSPGVRFVAGIAGAMLVRHGCTRRFPVACALGTVGLGLLTRAVTNRPLWTSAVNRRNSGAPPAGNRLDDDVATQARHLQESWPF